MKMLRLLAGVIGYVSLFIILLFLPAGTLHWWRAWVFIAILFAARVIGDRYVARVNESLAAKRRKLPLQEGQPLADRILLISFMLTFAGLVAFTGLDVFRFHLLPKPGVLVSTAGLVLFVIGWWMVALSLATNAFAVTVVRHQEERHHTVVDRGPYVWCVTRCMRALTECRGNVSLTRIVCRGTRGECVNWHSHASDRSRRTLAPAEARRIRRLHNEGAMAIDPGTVVSRVACGSNS